jgi:hypothetical protein
MLGEDNGIAAKPATVFQDGSQQKNLSRNFTVAPFAGLRGRDAFYRSAKNQ